MKPKDPASYIMEQDSVGRPIKLPKEILSNLSRWKKECSELYAIPIRGKWFVYRPATLRESQTFLQLSKVDMYPVSIDVSQLNIGPGIARTLATGIADQFPICNPFLGIAQDYLLACCLIHPSAECTDDMDQGAVSFLLRMIWESTGFSNIETFIDSIDAARARIKSTIDDSIVAFVSKSLGLKPSEVYDMNLETMSSHIAMAEYVTNTELPIQLKVPRKPKPANQVSPSKTMQPNPISKPKNIDFEKENLEYGSLGYSASHGESVKHDLDMETSKNLSDTLKRAAIDARKK